MTGNATLVISESQDKSDQMKLLRLISLLNSLPVLICSLTLAAEAVAETTHIEIPSPVINEASALTRSHRHPEVLWTLNDSGGDAAVYALNTNGELLATLSLTGPSVINQDWEDMGSFSRGNKHYLLIADVGDNFAWRPNISLYLIEEPSLPNSPEAAQNLKAAVLHTFRVQLPNGPRDIEAIAVAPDENAAYLISKRDNQPLLYRVSLDYMNGNRLSDQTATNLGAIRIPRADRNNHNFNWITAMDFSESGRWAYVGTLRNGYRYARAPGQSWQEALQQQPIVFSQPRLRQIEGGCFDWHDDRQIFVISETLPAKMGKITLPLP